MTSKIDSLSIPEARKLILLSQRIPPVKQSGSALDATLSTIEHLGYIQIDTISVVQRAHHHTLWSRNPQYKLNHLEQLANTKQIFEYWSHAASFLPMKDYRFSLPRKQAIKNHEQNHWYKRDAELMDSVLKRIATEGPLMAKDFDHKGEKFGEWQTKPTKQALENLFMQGDLMVSSRKNFHKVYDITERVLPSEINTIIPTKQEYAQFLITRFLEANGIGLVSEMVYLLKNIKPIVASTVLEMIEEGKITQLNVGGTNYIVLRESLELLNKPLSRTKLKILSPFDNLLIQRKRMQALFQYEYLLECYVPEAKRKYGYFCLPILWDSKLVARADCKADRKTKTLHISHLALEPTLKKLDAFTTALCKELSLFMEFNDCTQVILHRTSPTNYTNKLVDALKQIQL